MNIQIPLDEIYFNINDCEFLLAGDLVADIELDLENESFELIELYTCVDYDCNKGFELQDKEEVHLDTLPSRGVYALVLEEIDKRLDDLIAEYSDYEDPNQENKLGFWNT